MFETTQASGAFRPFRWGSLRWLAHVSTCGAERHAGSTAPADQDWRDELSEWHYVLIGLGSYFVLSLISALLFARVCALGGRLDWDGLEFEASCAPFAHEEREVA